MENALRDNPKVADYDISQISYKKADRSFVIECNVPRDENKIFAALADILTDFPNFNNDKPKSKND